MTRQKPKIEPKPKFNYRYNATVKKKFFEQASKVFLLACLFVFLKKGIRFLFFSFKKDVWN